MWWFIVLIVLLCYWFYVKFIKILSYWKVRNVPYSEANIIFGALYKLLSKQITVYDLIKAGYNKFPDRRYSGSFQFTKPVLIIKDVELIKKICIKDFDHFVDHNSQINQDTDPVFSKNLVTLKGDVWKDMRATLSPAFTASKMKGMYNLIDDCTKEFVKYFTEQLTDKDVIEIEMKDTTSRFANDVIASTAFGIKCDSLKDRDNDFFKMGQDVTANKPLRLLKVLIMQMSKTLTKIFKLRAFPEASDFFEKIVTEAVRKREELKIIRPDMIHLLMESRKGRLQYDDDQNDRIGFAVVDESPVGKIHKKLRPPITDLDIAAQAMLFFLAGFETVSTAFSFLTYELAVNPDVQETLQKEIDDVLAANNNTITYDQLLKMKYLDMVISETLRKWPPAPGLDRKCVRNYNLTAVNDEESDLLVETDMMVSIPILGIHYDPKYYPNPEKFDPERFSEENKANFNPYAYMPFGVGPRNCIGSRFALLEIKLFTFNVLSKFDLVPVKKTCVPMVLSKKKFSIGPDEGFWIGLKLRKKDS